MNIKVNPDKLPTETKCSFCPGTICCSYTTQQIDSPRKIDDFDHLLWQMAHKNLQVYKDEDGWFLLILNQCQFLQVNGSCGIYETRPQVCRDYKNDYCEFDAPAEDGFELFFDGYNSLLKYCQKRFKKWNSRFIE